jgi:pyrroloquinoline quinone (PQQ) biosynthesis protein C
MITPVTEEKFKAPDAYVPRRQTTDPTINSFIDQTMNHILQHRALEHPFFNNYARHGLPAEKSQTLYLETLHYFKYLPFYICGIAALTTDDEVLRFIAFNAMDELGDNYSHSDMYRAFMVKKGISIEQITNYKPLPSTIALNEGIRTLYNTRPLSRALGALFADETLSASLVSKYNDGLIKEGLSDTDRYFWTLHCEVEVGHSNAVFNITEPYLQTKEDREAFREGVDQYLFLMENYWDGIEQLINHNFPQ